MTKMNNGNLGEVDPTELESLQLTVDETVRAATEAGLAADGQLSAEQLDEVLKQVHLWKIQAALWAAWDQEGITIAFVNGELEFRIKPE